MTHPSDRFAGRTVLVSGGGSGIGLACARRLADEGAHVTVCGRTESRLKEAVDALGEQARYAVCDVADEADIDRAVAVAAEPTGRLDHAIVNAGYGVAGAVVDLDRAEWESVIATNLTGAFLTVKLAARAIAAGGGGSIAAMSSIAGGLTHRFMAPYNVSKAGLEMLVRTAADELGGQGVRVNAIRPGLVPTDASTPLVETDAIREDYLGRMPLGRVGTVEDIAAAASFLLSDDASWITGHVLDVDGGHHLRGGPDVGPLIAQMHGSTYVESAGLRR